MLRCAKEAGDASTIDLNRVFTSLINAMVKADMYTEESLLLRCFTDSVRVVASPLPPNLINHFIRSVDGMLADLEAQRENRVIQVEWMDDVERQEEREVEAEETACLNMMEEALRMVMEVNSGEKEVVQLVEVALRRMTKAKGMVMLQ
jgi:hypothetical protein